jgi:superfamily II DNA/RNA helicase
MDVKDIWLVMQWRLTCDPTTLWQRLGQAGRDRRTDVEMTGVFLVEKEHFDDEKAKKVERSKKQSKKHKQKDTKGSLTLFPNKRRNTAPSTADNSIAPANPGSSTIADASVSDHESSDDDEFKTLQTMYSETRDKP